MALLDDLADKLAIDVLKVVDKLGDDQLIKDVAKILAASSTPMEEAFLSCARMRQAEQRARAYLRAHVVQELGRENG